MEAVTLERGILEVQIGSQRVRQFHAHLLTGLSLLQHVYLTSYARILTGNPSLDVSLERGILSVFARSMRI